MGHFLQVTHFAHYFLALCFMLMLSECKSSSLTISCIFRVIQKKAIKVQFKQKLFVLGRVKKG